MLPGRGMFTTLQRKGRVIASCRSNRCKEERIVASDDRLSELEERYEGYRVYDNAGESIGKVDDLFGLGVLSFLQI